MIYRHASTHNRFNIRKTANALKRNLPTFLSRPHRSVSGRWIDTGHPGIAVVDSINGQKRERLRVNLEGYDCGRLVFREYSVVIKINLLFNGGSHHFIRKSDAVHKRQAEHARQNRTCGEKTAHCAKEQSGDSNCNTCSSFNRALFWTSLVFGHKRPLRVYVDRSWRRRCIFRIRTNAETAPVAEDGVISNIFMALRANQERTIPSRIIGTLGKRTNDVS